MLRRCPGSDRRIVKSVYAKPASSTKDPKSLASTSANVESSTYVWKLYDTKFKDSLEPRYNGMVLAVDLDSDDYEVSKRSVTAWKALKLRGPEGRIEFLIIGPVNRNSDLDRR